MFSQPNRYTPPHTHTHTHLALPPLTTPLPPRLTHHHSQHQHLRFVWPGNLMQINFIYQNIHQNVCAATRPLEGTTPPRQRCCVACVYLVQRMHVRWRAECKYYFSFWLFRLGALQMVLKRMQTAPLTPRCPLIDSTGSSLTLFSLFANQQPSVNV